MSGFTKRALRAICCILVVVMLVGCGPHRVKYTLPSADGDATYETTRNHAHGIGPLIIGGGGFFFFLNEMSPALIDYTGVVQTRSVCPDGFTQVEHFHRFDQSALAALLSWLLIVNAYHQSDVRWTCVRAGRVS
jgi:hypothetical protein